MTFRPLLLASACALAAMTAACDGDSSVRISSTDGGDTDAKGVLKVVESLQCPQTMGSLTRKGSASAGGSVCTYVGPKGAEVSLHLVKLDGDEPGDALKAFESRLSGELPEAVAQLRAAARAERARAAADRAQAQAEQAQSQAEQARVAAAAAGDQATVRAPGVQVDANDNDASVRLPGIHIETKGDNASVRIGGFHIDANNRHGDSQGDVRIRGSAGGETVSVQAHDGTAEVRTRAAGEATRASWILTDDTASAAGWRLVAYEARGPAGGPLVVATIRTKERERGRVFEDARDLVALNVGE